MTSPTDSIPYSARIAIVTSTRARAASRSSPESISWPTAGWFCGRGDDHRRGVVGALTDRGQQLAPAGDLVEEGEDGLSRLAAHGDPATAGSGCLASLPSPAMIACLAPGTPNS